MKLVESDVLINDQRVRCAKRAIQNLSLKDCDVLFEVISLELAGHPPNRREKYTPLFTESDLNRNDEFDLKAVQIALLARRAILVKKKFEDSPETSDFR